MALLHRLTTLILRDLDIKIKNYQSLLPTELNKREKARPDPNVICIGNAVGESPGGHGAVVGTVVCA